MGAVWMGPWHVMFEVGTHGVSPLVSPMLHDKSAVVVAPNYMDAISIPSTASRRALRKKLPMGYERLMENVRESLVAQQRAGTSLPRQSQPSTASETAEGDVVLLNKGESYTAGQLHVANHIEHGRVVAGKITVYQLRSIRGVFKQANYEAVGVCREALQSGHDVAVRLQVKQQGDTITASWPSSLSTGYSEAQLARLHEQMDPLRVWLQDVLQSKPLLASTCFLSWLLCNRLHQVT